MLPDGIVDSGARALHNKDSEASAKYNLEILYGKGGSKAKPEPATAATPAPASAPAK